MKLMKKIILSVSVALLLCHVVCFADDAVLHDYQILVNKNNPLPASFVPSDLIRIDTYGIKTSGTQLLHREAADQLAELIYNLRLQNIGDVTVVSAYRTYDEQQTLYSKGNKNYVASPGASEHQMGLAVDLAVPSNLSLTSAFAETPQGRWLAQNAHHYGFILRYEKDKTRLTNISYEPWHFRYVGAELATYLKENNICLEEFYLPGSHWLSDYVSAQSETAILKTEQASESVWHKFFVFVHAVTLRKQ